MPPRPWLLHTRNVSRTQMFTRRAWKESSFQWAVSAWFSSQSHLLLLLYSSDTLWQLPRLQSFQVSIFMLTKNYRGKEQQIGKQRKNIAALSCRIAAAPHYFRGMKCTSFPCTAEPLTSNLSQAVPLPPQATAQQADWKAALYPLAPPLPWAQYITAKLV